MKKAVRVQGECLIMGAAPQLYGPDCLQRESESEGGACCVEGKHSGRGLVVAMATVGMRLWGWGRHTWMMM